MKWRDRLEAEPAGIDWREMVHPSARPRSNNDRLSTGASSAAKEPPVENALTDVLAEGPPCDCRLRRRSFTDEEKFAIVLESEQPGANAADVCRRHDIATSMLFRWRVQFGFGKSKPVNSATVRVAGERPGRTRNAASEAVVLHELLPIRDGFIAVDLPDGRRVFAPAGSNPEGVRQQGSEREARP